jgi:hypothetical protein
VNDASEQLTVETDTARLGVAERIQLVVLVTVPVTVTCPSDVVTVDGVADRVMTGFGVLDVEAPAGDAPATAPSAVPATTAPTRRCLQELNQSRGSMSMRLHHICLYDSVRSRCVRFAGSSAMSGVPRLREQSIGVCASLMVPHLPGGQGHPLSKRFANSDVAIRTRSPAPASASSGDPSAAPAYRAT